LLAATTRHRPLRTRWYRVVFATLPGKAGTAGRMRWNSAHDGPGGGVADGRSAQVRRGPWSIVSDRPPTACASWHPSVWPSRSSSTAACWCVVNALTRRGRFRPTPPTAWRTHRARRDGVGNPRAGPSWLPSRADRAAADQVPARIERDPARREPSTPWSSARPGAAPGAGTGPADWVKLEGENRHVADELTGVGGGSARDRPGIPRLSVQGVLGPAFGPSPAGRDRGSSSRIPRLGRLPEPVEGWLRILLLRSRFRTRPGTRSPR